MNYDESIEMDVYWAVLTGGGCRLGRVVDTLWRQDE